MTKNVSIATGLSSLSVARLLSFTNIALCGKAHCICARFQSQG
ncbi:hypothetical protein [Vibrio marisflavi]|uniref:Uncharacterized protein n=1 Tax=Vibrio marisflavi CECT 7928 TaxID=634439 RepID=A0ABM9A037_9VIBR|nr:hypothetical protein [Vibrio marisflavi]CAH0536620.1 hypothetical protein VMF7928_00575 [Vibrio marisflavi CECT 7928]